MSFIKTILNLWITTVLICCIFLFVADSASAAKIPKIPKSAIKEALPLIGLLAGVFKFLIGPATIIGSGIYAKNRTEEIKIAALIVAAIGGMACLYFWFEAGISFFGIIGYIFFGLLGVIGYFKILKEVELPKDKE